MDQSINGSINQSMKLLMFQIIQFKNRGFRLNRGWFNGGDNWIRIRILHWLSPRLQFLNDLFDLILKKTFYEILDFFFSFKKVLERNSFYFIFECGLVDRKRNDFFSHARIFFPKERPTNFSPQTLNFPTFTFHFSNFSPSSPISTFYFLNFWFFDRWSLMTGRNWVLHKNLNFVSTFFLSFKNFLWFLWQELFVFFRNWWKKMSATFWCGSWGTLIRRWWKTRSGVSWWVSCCMSPVVGVGFAIFSPIRWSLRIWSWTNQGIVLNAKTYFRVWEVKILFRHRWSWKPPLVLQAWYHVRQANRWLIDCLSSVAHFSVDWLIDWLIDKSIDVVNFFLSFKSIKQSSEQAVN